MSLHSRRKQKHLRKSSKLRKTKTMTILRLRSGTRMKTKMLVRALIQKTRNRSLKKNLRMPLTSKTQRQSLPMKTLAFLRFMISLNQKKSQSKRHSRKTMPSTQV